MVGESSPKSTQRTTPSSDRDCQSPSAFTPYDPLTDPFVNLTESLSTWNKIKLVFPGLIFGPIRLVLGIGSMILCALLCNLILIGVRRSKPARPLIGWRAKTVEFLTRGTAWVLLFSLGFFHVKVRGKIASRKEAPIVVCNHCAAWEAFALNYVAGVTFLSKAENGKVPFLGTCMRAMQCVFVARDSAESRNAVVDEIRRRSTEDGWPQLAIFPEGTAVNQRVLLAFRTGAFQPGVPVQPVIAKFPFKYMDPTFTGHKVGLGGLTIRLVTQWYNQIELHFLPVYVPSEAEKANPQLFADNVRAVMSKAGAIGISEYNVEDYFVTNEAVKMGIPPKDAVVGMERLRQVLNLGMADVKETMRLFKDMDVRRRGEVTYADFLASLGLEASDALRATFDRIAGSPSAESINFRQFLHTMFEHSRQLTDEEEIRLAFEIINIKGDGKITEDELEANMILLSGAPNSANLEENRERARALFKKVDHRKAGYIDFLQFGTFVRSNPSWMELFEQVREEQRSLGTNVTLEMLARRADGNPMSLSEFRAKAVAQQQAVAEAKKTK